MTATHLYHRKGDGAVEVRKSQGWREGLGFGGRSYRTGTAWVGRPPVITALSLTPGCPSFQSESARTLPSASSRWGAVWQSGLSDRPRARCEPASPACRALWSLGLTDCRVLLLPLTVLCHPPCTLSRTGWRRGGEGAPAQPGCLPEPVHKRGQRLLPGDHGGGQGEEPGTPRLALPGRGGV